MRNTACFLSLEKQPLADVTRKAADVLKRGGILIYPTDTIYGLGADPFQPEAVEKLYRLKGRSFSKPIHVLIGSLQMLSRLVTEIPLPARRLLEAFWPGPLTLILKARPGLSGQFLGKDHTIGVRLPAHKFCQMLSIHLNGPVLSTSANLSGEPNPLRLEEISKNLLDSVDAVIDGGPSETLIPSTIVKIEGDSIFLVREGAIPGEKIAARVGQLEKV